MQFEEFIELMQSRDDEAKKRFNELDRISKFKIYEVCNQLTN